MSSLSEFRFCHFRGFTSEQVVKFAIPNGMAGSGITYIVGENNSGKTSVLEAMALRGVRKDGSNYYNSPSELRTSDVRDDDIFFAFYDDNSSLVENLALIGAGSFTLIDKIDTEKNGLPPLFTNFAPLFIPARRYWSPKLNGGGYFGSGISMRNYNQGVTLRQIPDHSPMQQQIADVFYRIELDDELYKKYIDTIRQIFPDFESFTVVNEDIKSISYKMDDGTRHRADFLGEGVVSVMCILAYLLDNDDCMLIMDEPELSLHPLAQKRLADVVANFAMTRQIVISTHSPYLVRWEYIKNGARLNRVVKSGSNAMVHCLGDYSTYEPLINGANWQQPFLADEVSREVFFYDNVLFVEGQDDKGLLKQDGVLSGNINVFGYGVRGFTNFSFALRLARDIGITKAGILIDKGDKEDAVVEELRSEFPNYRIFQWGREDIRDKSGYCGLGHDGNPDLSKLCPSKEGYFTKEGKKKAPDQLDDYDEKIAQINDYFSDVE